MKLVLLTTFKLILFHGMTQGILFNIYWIVSQLNPLWLCRLMLAHADFELVRLFVCTEIYVRNVIPRKVQNVIGIST